MTYQIIDNDKKKIVKSENYNSIFNKENGSFYRWGKTVKEDPEYSPLANEILDIEVSTICSGINGKPCKMCYKSNTSVGKNMSLETFKAVINKMPKIMNQVAIGIGDIDSNPDLFNMMEFCRDKDIIPNTTINGWNLTDEYANKLVSLCGAVSVSKYEPKDVCYSAVKKLTDLGLKQCNIHQLVSKQTLESCYEVINDYNGDERLSNLNAIVFMSLKPKGNRNKYNIISFEEYQALIKYAIDKNVPIGSDSCGAGAMYRVFESIGKKDIADRYIESCESFGLFSAYINVEATYFPCSFAEGEKDWESGIDVLNCNDFTKDIWFSEKLNKYREISLNNKDCNGCRKCLIFDEINIGE